MLARGMYAHQLAPWLHHFDRDHLLVIRSEEFYAAPDRWLDIITSFLNLPPTTYDTSKAYNFGAKNVVSGVQVDKLGERYSSKMDPTISAELHRWFAPYNAQLSQLLVQHGYPHWETWPDHVE